MKVYLMLELVRGVPNPRFGRAPGWAEGTQSPDASQVLVTGELTDEQVRACFEEGGVELTQEQALSQAQEWNEAFFRAHPEAHP